jgi:hypothetical protein
MVIAPHIFWLRNVMLLALHQPGDAVIEKLDPPVRAAVIMALLGLTLVGLFLITFIMVGGHWVRRLARHRPAPRNFAKNIAAEGGLSDTLDIAIPEHKSGDTLLLDTSSKDTKVET